MTHSQIKAERFNTTPSLKEMLKESHLWLYDILLTSGTLMSVYDVDSINGGRGT